MGERDGSPPHSLFTYAVQLDWRGSAIRLCFCASNAKGCSDSSYALIH